MTGSIEEWTSDIHCGDSAETLADMPESSVHCVMTSPPYWNLRDYDVNGQLGLEATPEEYVENIADVCDAIQRVLRDDGSLWLNLGDTYDDKDLQQIPARVALELQQRGWTLRNRVTWAKPNPMPQSVKDRLNDTTEAIFHFVKSKRYWYDLDAIREPHAESTQERMGEGYGNAGDNKYKTDDTDGNHNNGGIHDPDKGYDELLNSAGKNPGDVFEVTTKPFPDAHFAVYPPELVEKPIKATCPQKVCAECGGPYDRDVELERSPGSAPGKGDGDVPIDAQVEGGHQRDGHDYTRTHISAVKTKGWLQTCDCDIDETEPGIVLDPFAGAGTTLLVAKDLGRRFVGIDLNEEYVALAQKRVGLDVENPELLDDVPEDQARLGEVME